MTREITVPAVLVRRIKKSDLKKRHTARSLAVRADAPVKREAKPVAVRSEVRSSLEKIAKASANIVMTVARLVAFVILSVVEFFDEVWERFQDKCGEEIIKMGEDGIFGNGDEGYYHTPDGFRLDASKIEIVRSKKMR